MSLSFIESVDFPVVLEEFMPPIRPKPRLFRRARPNSGGRITLLGALPKHYITTISEEHQSEEEVTGLWMVSEG
jgi:hypothetical protein